MAYASVAPQGLLEQSAAEKQRWSATQFRSSSLSDSRASYHYDVTTYSRQSTVCAAPWVPKLGSAILNMTPALAGTCACTCTRTLLPD
eukprot:521376-Amphidinium_carterae.4